MREYAPSPMTRSPRIVSVSIADQMQLSDCRPVPDNSRAYESPGSTGRSVYRRDAVEVDNEARRVRIEARAFPSDISAACPSRSVGHSHYSCSGHRVKERLLPASGATPVLRNDCLILKCGEIRAIALCWIRSVSTIAQTENRFCLLVIRPVIRLRRGSGRVACSNWHLILLAFAAPDGLDRFIREQSQVRQRR